MRNGLKRFLSVFITLVLILGLIPVASFAAADLTEGDLADNKTAAPTPDTVVPTQSQIWYAENPGGAFIHFGMNTYTNKEWGNGKETPSQFTLSNDFDADTVVKTLKDAGFSVLTITSKHHDGFCIWPSEYTEHSIKNTEYYKTRQANPEKKNKWDGDLLAEISAACTKYDMEMGLYLSPWDVNAVSYGYRDAEGNETTPDKDVLDYNDYYDNQLKEVLGNPIYGNNGRFRIVWMDGAKGGGSMAQEYDFDRWNETIQEYQGMPKYENDCLLFNGGANNYTLRWIGNEAAFSGTENWSKSTVNYANGTMNDNMKSESNIGYTRGFPDGNRWTVGHCGSRTSADWFWHQNPALKSIKALGNMYFTSCGRNTTNLLNFAPNREGTFDAAMIKLAQEYGAELRTMYGSNFATAEKGASATASAVRGSDIAFSPNNLIDGDSNTYWTMNDGQKTGSVTIKLGTARIFDVIELNEHIKLGQRISSFTVEYKNGGGEWTMFEANGKTVGGKTLVRSSPVKATDVRISITGATGVPMLSGVSIYKAGKNFELSEYVNTAPESLTLIDDRAMSREGTWATSSVGLESTSLSASDTASKLNFTFTGSKLWIMGHKDKSNGIGKVSVDGVEIGTFDGYSASRTLSQVLFESGNLEHGEHTVTLQLTGKRNFRADTEPGKIEIDGAYYLNNGGTGVAQLEKGSFSVVAGNTLALKVKRIGGTAGDLRVSLQTESSSAQQGQDYENIKQEVIFANGESEKTVNIATYSADSVTGDLDFTVELLSPAGENTTGFNKLARVTIELFDTALEKQLTDANEWLAGWYLPAGWDVFAKKRTAANEVYEKQDATESEIRTAISELQAAMDALTARTIFTEEDPFVLPTKAGDIGLLEAEFFTLIKAAGNVVRIEPEANASKGEQVNWMPVGTVIKVPYKADRAGMYQVTARYRSGRKENDPNAIDITGDHIRLPQKVKVWGDPSSWQTVTFDMEITQAGTSWLNITANAGTQFPILDKFEIEAKSYTITANAGAHGSISDAGASKVLPGGGKTYIITPDAGYRIKDVKVDNVSVGAVESYEFTNVQKDAIISAEFEQMEATDQDNADIAAAKPLVEDIVYTTEQTEVGTEAAAKAKVEAILAALERNGVDMEVTTVSYTPAKMGTIENQNGTDGSYVFTVALSKGVGTTVITKELTLAIIATPYQPKTDVPDQPAAPAVLKAPAVSSVKSQISKGTSRVCIRLNKVEGATSYQIYRMRGKKTVYLGKTSNGVFYDKKPVGTKVTYLAKASNGTKVSTMGQGKSITLPEAVAKVSAKAVQGKKAVKVSWRSVKGATGYQVFRSYKSKTGYKGIALIKKGKTKTYTDTRVKKGKKCYYRVISMKKKLYGPVKTSKWVKVK